MSFVQPKAYREFYEQLYSAEDIHSALLKHYKETRKSMPIPYSVFIMNFIKYLVWNLKGTAMKDFPRTKIPSMLKLKGFELMKNVPYEAVSDPFKFRPIGEKSLKILAIISTYYNTDAPELIPETGSVLPLVEDMFKFYNKKQEQKGAFGLVLGIVCKHNPYIIGKNGPRTFITQ